MNRVILACGFGLVSVVLLEGRAASESPILTPVDMAFGPDGSAVVTTTAGAFVRPAASKTFHFVCPAAFGSGASAFSPLVEIGESGTTSVTSFSGLFQSRGSCQFERATLYGQSSVIVFEERWIAAIESRSETTWIATADSHHRNDIYVSTGSREFRSLGLESGRNWFLSLHADESGRLYASGYRVANPGAKTRAEGFLLRDGAQLPARGLTFGRSGRARVVLTVGALTVWVVVEGALEPTATWCIGQSMAANRSRGFLKPVVVWSVHGGQGMAASGWRPRVHAIRAWAVPVAFFVSRLMPMIRSRRSTLHRPHH